MVPLLLLGIFALFLLLLFWPRHRPTTPPDVSIAAAPEMAGGQLSSANKEGQTKIKESPRRLATAPVAVPAETYSEEALPDKLEQLQNLAMSGTPNALSMITFELGNSDARIRSAAREATIQFGDRSAIPALEDAIALVEDSQEKAALRSAIEFLQLPSLTEAANQQPQ